MIRLQRFYGRKQRWRHVPSIEVSHPETRSASFPRSTTKRKTFLHAFLQASSAIFTSHFQLGERVYNQLLYSCLCRLRSPACGFSETQRTSWHRIAEARVENIFVQNLRNALTFRSILLLISLEYRFPSS